jgi:TetR/AcrR family transcriptional regulator
MILTVLHHRDTCQLFAIHAPKGARVSSVPNSQSTNHKNGRLRRRYLARRLEILRAAGNEFRVRGFAETGMRDIAAAADLSPANLYNYFRGKHEILFFCQDVSLDRMINALEKARPSRARAADKLRLVIVSHIRCVLDEVEGSAAHLLTGALPPRLQRALVMKRDRYEDGVRQLIAAGIRTGEFVACDPALSARAILGALNWSARWFSPEGSLTAAEIAEGFADYLIRGLLTKPQASRRSGELTKLQHAMRVPVEPGTKSGTASA